MTSYSGSVVRQNTAWHEAGHLAVASAFNPEPVWSIIVREDHRGGYVRWKIRHSSRQEALILIAGAVAEVLFTTVERQSLFYHISYDMRDIAAHINSLDDYSGDDLPTWACELAADIHSRYGYSEYKLLTAIMEARAIINKVQPQMRELVHEFARGRKQMFRSTAAIWTNRIHYAYQQGVNK